MRKINYTPTPGYILIDPLEKDKKSDYMAVQDSVDRPHKGTVVAVGGTKISDYGIKQESPVKVEDQVLYSIAGVEETKLEYKGDPRKRMIIVPFGRVLLRIENEK